MSFPPVEYDHRIWEARHNIGQEQLIEEYLEKNPEKREQVYKSLEKGEPAPYIVNNFYFRNRSFYVNSGAYITDPEATYLVDVVKSLGEVLIKHKGIERPQIAEFGIGGGTLSISLSLENDRFSVVGFDVDSNALLVAEENKKRLLASIDIFESDFFKSWPYKNQPDIIFADPPWGSREDLYDNQRDAKYYDRMPVLSAYPQNGRIGLHSNLISEIRKLKWTSLVIMNLGIIPGEVFSPLLTSFKNYHIYRPTDEIKILVGYINFEENENREL